jgi:1-acyl-sn-glycerol-3-phosphate acyltransferase
VPATRQALAPVQPKRIAIVDEELEAEIVKRLCPERDGAPDFVPASKLYSAFTAVWWVVVASILAVLHRAWFNFRIVGREHLAQVGKRGCVVVANHSLFLDPALVGYGIVPQRGLYGAHRGHFKVAAARLALPTFGAFPIPKTVDTLARGTQRALDRGYWVCFWPEGHMTHLGQDIQPFHTGAFRTAQLLNVPVLPVTLVHWPRRIFGVVISKHLRSVRCVIHAPRTPPPIAPGDDERAAAARFAEEVRQSMRDAIVAHTPA